MGHQEGQMCPTTPGKEQDPSGTCCHGLRVDKKPFGCRSPSIPGPELRWLHHLWRRRASVPTLCRTFMSLPCQVTPSSSTPEHNPWTSDPLSCAPPPSSPFSPPQSLSPLSVNPPVTNPENTSKRKHTRLSVLSCPHSQLTEQGEVLPPLYR